MATKLLVLGRGQRADLTEPVPCSEGVAVGIMKGREDEPRGNAIVALGITAERAGPSLGGKVRPGADEDYATRGVVEGHALCPHVPRKHPARNHYVVRARRGAVSRLYTSTRTGGTGAGRGAD